MTTPSDHPPAIPPIGVRTIVLEWVGYSWNGSRAMTDFEPRQVTVPLGLAPEQPARLSGEAMP